ncbi:MAG: response regulator transcription factor [Methylomicrobium sp.]|nr:response regulator transcription factor [Methylomicrobium sp.]
MKLLKGDNFSATSYLCSMWENLEIFGASVESSDINVKHDPLRVLVVDDHDLLVEALIASLSAEFGFEVQAANCVDAGLELISQSGSFDVILLDYNMPGTSGIEGLSRVNEANGGRVVLFSGLVNRTTVELALDQGCSGYIPKTMHLRSLGHAIRIVAGGDVFLPAAFSRWNNEVGSNTVELKPREQRVLALLSEGMQNKEIGNILNLDEVIIKMDVKSICRKLNVRNRTQAAIKAMKYGVL